MTTTSGPTFDLSEVAVSAAGSSQSLKPWLEALPRKFHEAVTRAPATTVSSILALAAEELGAVLAIGCQENSEGQLLPAHVYSSATRKSAAETMLPELMQAARIACRARCVKQTRSVAANGYQIVAVPAFHPDRPTSAVVFCLPPEIQAADRVMAAAMYAAVWLYPPSGAPPSPG